MNSALFTECVMREAKAHEQRTGQYLFNLLPASAGNVVAGTLWDPFHKEMTTDEVFKWVDAHLIFDGFDIIGVFSGNQVLWEASSKDTNA